MWSWPRPFQGQLVVRRLTHDTAYNYTKFDDSSFNHSTVKSVWNLKLVTWPWPRPFQGRFVIDRLGHAMLNQPTKFEVSNFIGYGNMKGVVKCRKWACLGWLGVTQAYQRCRHSIECIYDFLFIFNGNYTSILYRLWYISFDRSTTAQTTNNNQTTTFLPERDYVTFGSLLPPISLSSVCHLSVTLVHPNQGVEPFGNISSPLCTVAILWPLCKILWRLSQGNPSVGGAKRKRGIKIERFRTYRRLYLINGTR